MVPMPVLGVFVSYPDIVHICITIMTKTIDRINKNSCLEPRPTFLFTTVFRAALMWVAGKED